MNLIPDFKKWPKVITILMAASLLWGALIGGALKSSEARAEGEKITKTTVVGNKRIESDAILEKMKLKAGSVVSSDQVRQDIQAIFALGFFEDVRFDLTNGLLTVQVRERPVVVDISYEGADEFEKKDLDEATSLKPFVVLNLAKIRQAQVAISKKYEEKGYYLARSDFELRPVEKNPSEVKLIFHIQENERVRIRRVFFFGNKHFSSGDLKQVMITTEGHAFSWATGGGTYRPEAFERDLAALAYFYGNEGYVQAKFAKPRVSLSQDRRYIDVLIDVDEGKQFYLGNVTFKGDLLFSEEDLRKSFEMKEGDVFSTGKLQEQVLKLTDKYGDEGYAFANVIPRPQYREGTEIVDLTFDVERGEKVYWGKITVTGNSKTHDKVVRRELPFAEGDLYNATKRKKGVERIRRLGFFGSDVNFLTSTPKGSTNILDLDIKVTEKPTGTLNVSAGFGTATGFTLQGQVSQNNLMGVGEQLAFNMSINTRTDKQFNLQFTDPHAFDTNWLMGLDLYVQDSQVGGSSTVPRSYDERIYGTDYRFGREIADSLNLFGTYKLARQQIYNPLNPAIIQNTEDLDTVVSSVTATLAYDSRNNRLDPSGGEFLSSSAEFAGLGGRVFQKYLLTARLYRRLFWKLVFRSNLEYGLVTNNFTNNSVPDTEKFILGGIFSLRGYPQASVGPGVFTQDIRDIDPNGLTNPNGSPILLYPNFTTYPVGGTHKLLANEEIEFPLIPEADIRLAIFFDAGNAWNSRADLATNPVYADYGWGIRWYSPLGPLRFEWGYPLQVLPSKGNLGSEFQFIIAPTF